MFLQKKPRREIVMLNVIPLIDISSMIIIFLIMGTIFGESSIEVPNGLKVPKSEHKDTVSNAPRIILSKDSVQVAFLEDIQIELNDFRDEDSPKMKAQVKKISDYVKNIPTEQKKGGVLLNVVADETTPYRDIFDVVAVFRKAGFDSILFVAMGK